jgi:hypothetical protein
MRTIFEFSAENAKIVDWLADDAVCCELLSDEEGLMVARSFEPYSG